ncbi:MAG: response regulator transcription factor [Lachnospiraceae bacterium]|nr:response regulator transcription factor [Lachnospiraceae bacterium]
MKKVMILEDQKDSRDALLHIVKSVDESAKIFAVGRANSAYSIAMEHSIDLFLIDIILRPEKRGGDQSGAEFAQNIRMIERYKFTPMIFVTSLYDTKMHLYSSLHCYQFIEKPFDQDKVAEIIRGAMAYQTESDRSRMLFYRTGGLLEAITIGDIVYAESRSHQLRVITVKEEIQIPYRTCKEFLRELDSEDFLQCNRSTIVNRNFIKKIDPVNRYIYLEERPETLEIGSIMKREFLNSLRSI